MSITISSPFCPDKPDGLNISSDGQTLISVGNEVSGTIKVPEGIIHINDWAFSNSLVKEVELPSTLRSFGDRVFDSCRNLLKISIPEGVEELTFSLFRGCSSLWQVTLPQSLIQIGTASFEYCRSLKTIIIPKNVKEIGSSAFGECTALNSCQLPEGLESIGQGAFEGCSSLKSIILPQTLKQITWQAFMGCSSLSYIFIPELVSEVGSRAFAGTNAFIEVDEKNTEYSSYQGSLFDKSLETMHHYHASNPNCIIDAPDSLVEFGAGVFGGNNILRNVEIKINAKSLSNFPFYGCQNLKRLILPEGLVQFDGCGACPNLEEVYLPDSLEEISQCAFEHCTSLKKIKLPKNLKKLGYSHQGQVFCGCKSLEHIEINECLEFIAPSTFAGCTNLKAVSLPDGITSIGGSAFSGCNKISELRIPSSVQTIGSGAFKNCESLEQIVCITPDLKIENNAFCGCVNLRRIEINTFSITDLFVKYSDCIDLEEIVYCENSLSKVFMVKNARNEWKDKLRLMSMFYYNMDMNVTRIKGNAKEINSFKQPFDNEDQPLSMLKTEKMDHSHLLNLQWDNVSGIALVLDWNCYQAIDIDNINNLDNMSDLIESYLAHLGLPSNYQWVIKSGSEKGFHIIYKSERVDKDVEVYPFAPKNNEYKTLEIRTGGILVLPPSIHYSGKNYEFLNGDIPTSLPIKIETNQLNKFLLEVCGDVAFSNYTFNNINFDLCEYKKICSRNYSQSDSVSHFDDSIEWLSKCDSSYSINSYAIRLVLGKDINADRKKALDYFKKANNDYAYFNIASLMSVGYFSGSLGQIDYYLDKINVDNLYSCDSEQNYLSPNERIKQIRDNAKIHTKQGNLVLFFDTETTGIPNNYDLPSSYTDNWPRMVQISWILMTDDGQRLQQKNYIIKPSNFTIPESSSKIHGITTEYAYAHGANLADVLLEFMKDFNHANLIVGHNISFDRNVVGAELIRQGLEDKMDEKQYVCTMKSTKKFCNLRSFLGLKYPKLQELHKKLFGYEFDDAHNAASDIEATQKCYWELKSKNII